MIGLLLGQWRAGLYGLLAAGLIIGAITVVGWKNQAARAQDLTALYQGALDARVKSDAAARELTRQRDAARAYAVELETQTREGQQHETVRTIIKRVVVHVPDDIRCDLNADVIELLDRARSPEPAVSEAPANTAPAAAEPEADHGTVWDKLNPF